MTIVSHLNKHNLIRDTQHGFRNKKSCLTNLLQFFNRVIEDYDEHKAVDIIYLDFKKAFDLVPHKKLIVKLESHGIQGNVINWIKEWLNDRKQRVVINGISSDFMKITSGVPQGSVLGPLLFLIYVNDLDDNIFSNIVKFADDTKISGLANSVVNCNTLQDSLNRIITWCETWGMDLNIDKCTYLSIGSKNINFTYNMKGKPLNKTNEQKDLGVKISSNLKFSKQCSESSKKANKVLGLISRSFDYKSKEVILPLYKSLVRPHLEYAVQLWNPYHRKDIEVLERVQRRATKLIPSLRNKSYNDRLKLLSLHSLETRRMRGELIEVYKILNNFDAIDGVLQLVNSNSITRSNGYKLVGKRFRSDIAKNFFANRVVNNWNALPKNVVDSPSINTFKNNLDEYFKIQNIR